MKRKVRKLDMINKINLKDWKKLIIKRGDIKKKADTQKILQQMRYGKSIYC